MCILKDSLLKIGKSDKSETEEFEKFMNSTGIGEKLEQIMIQELTQKGLIAEA